MNTLYFIYADYLMLNSFKENYSRKERQEEVVDEHVEEVVLLSEKESFNISFLKDAICNLSGTISYQTRLQVVKDFG